MMTRKETSLIGVFAVCLAILALLISPGAGRDPRMPGSCETATRMLEKLVREDHLTVEPFAAVLDAVHQEGRALTLYSNAFDLKKGIAYFYDRHQYDRVARLDVAATIKSAPPPRRIRDLFPH